MVSASARIPLSRPFHPVLPSSPHQPPDSLPRLRERVLVFLLLAAALLLTAIAAGARPAGDELLPLAAVAREVVLPPPGPGPQAGGELTVGGRHTVRIAAGLAGESHGTWEVLADGAWLWRLRIASPGAWGLRLELSPYDLAPGAALWVHDLDGRQVEGPFTRRHRDRHGRLTTPLVKGDELVVEVRIPANALAGTRFAIDTVHHRWRAPDDDELAGGNALCSPSNQRLCLLDRRFEVTASWYNQFNGTSGAARSVVSTDFSGFFYFTDPANIELMVKVLDFGDVYKVFYGQLTNLQFTLVIKDMVTGQTNTYHNGPNDCGAIDQVAFPSLDGDVIAWKHEGDAPQGTCVPSSTRLCLLNRRISVQATWRNQYNGQSGTAHVSSLSDLSGTLDYGDPRNVELLVKALDFGDRLLFIYGAVSDLEYRLTVTDTNTNFTKIYFNRAGSYCGGLDNDLLAPPEPTLVTCDGPSVSGSIDYGGEEDWFVFWAGTSTTYNIETTSGSLSDTMLYLYGPDDRSRFVESDDDDGVGLASRITRRLTAGTYWAKVRAYSSSTTGSYSLRVESCTNCYTGTTSQNLPIDLRRSNDGSTVSVSIRLRLSLATATCTGTASAGPVTVSNNQFSMPVTFPGSNITTTVRGTFSGDTASGTYTGYSGSFSLICGGYLFVGTGSPLSSGTWTASR